MLVNAFAALAFIGVATAKPISPRATGLIAKEWSLGGCRDILFAFARGSTEPGNMGIIIGPQTADGLKVIFGEENVAAEGIDYIAALSPNLIPGGTLPASEELMKQVLNDMASQCPDSIIVTGGYSQGGAVNHRAIEDLSPEVMDKIAGVVLFGDTQKTPDNNRIPNFPVEKTKFICQPGDVICDGILTVLPPHLTYTERADDAVAFLAERILIAQGKRKANKVVETVKGY